MLAEIQTYIHRYVDLSPQFERIASYYVLFSWLYDGFNELPYLRVRGDYGSGKTRFLLVVGSLCYKPVFATGASTVSPIFHILDAFRGTLVIDEGRFPLERRQGRNRENPQQWKHQGFAGLANGGVPHRGVQPACLSGLRPQARRHEGPVRGPGAREPLHHRGNGQSRTPEGYSDQPAGLVQRGGPLSSQQTPAVPIPKLWKEAAADAFVDQTLEPRLNQIFVPLLSIISDPTIRSELREVARERHREIVADRGMEVEAQLLEVIRDLEGQRSKLAIGDITAAFIDRYGKEYERPITNKWIGSIIRRRLNIKTQKSHGVSMISLTEQGRLKRLYDKYGLTDPLDGANS